MALPCHFGPCVGRVGHFGMCPLSWLNFEATNPVAAYEAAGAIVQKLCTEGSEGSEGEGIEHPWLLQIVMRERKQRCKENCT